MDDLITLAIQAVIICFCIFIALCIGIVVVLALPFIIPIALGLLFAYSIDAMAGGIINRIFKG